LAGAGVWLKATVPSASANPAITVINFFMGFLLNRTIDDLSSVRIIAAPP
jgi:hypothetical protein